MICLLSLHYNNTVVLFLLLSNIFIYHPPLNVAPAEADCIRKDYPDVENAYCCLGVLQGEGILYLVLVTECMQAGKINTMEVYRVTKTSLIPLHSNANAQESVVEMGKLLAGGQFYFSVGKIEDGFSLMGRAQRKGRDDPQFFWYDYHHLYMYTKMTIYSNMPKTRGHPFCPMTY